MNVSAPALRTWPWHGPWTLWSDFRQRADAVQTHLPSSKRFFVYASFCQHYHYVFQSLLLKLAADLSCLAVTASALRELSGERPPQLMRSEMQTCLLTMRPKAKHIPRLLDCMCWPRRSPVHLMRRKTQRIHGGQPPSKPATRLLLQEAPLIYLQRSGVPVAAGSRGGSSLMRPPWTLKQAPVPIPQLRVAAWAFHFNTQNNPSQKRRHKVRKMPGAPLHHLPRNSTSDMSIFQIRKLKLWSDITSNVIELISAALKCNCLVTLSPVMVVLNPG